MFLAKQVYNYSVLFCILQTAADGVPGANGFVEHFGAQRACNEVDVTHVHIQQ